MDIGPHSPTILKSKWADIHRLPHFYSWAYCFVHTKSLKSGALLAWIENIQWHSLKSLTNLTLICWKCDTTSNSPSRKLIALDCQRLDFLPHQWPFHAFVFLLFEMKRMFIYLTFQNILWCKRPMHNWSSGYCVFFWDHSRCQVRTPLDPYQYSL